MTGAQGPTMPIPRSLAAMCGCRPSDREVPVREVLSAIANTMGGTIAEHVAANTTIMAPPFHLAVADIVERLDALVDLWDGYVMPAPDPTPSPF